MKLTRSEIKWIASEMMAIELASSPANIYPPMKTKDMRMTMMRRL
jgi:hypothetical protein